MSARALRTILSIAATLLSLNCAFADALDDVFRDAKEINLVTSRAPSVLKLRDTIGIPAPDTPVLVKTFDPGSIPDALQPAFSRPGTSGVTVNDRYIAIIRTEFAREYEDVLNHELVHAYISLASPKPLPLWFQEASAVHFSTGVEPSVYGKPSAKHANGTDVKVVSLPSDYKQRLHNFHYLIEHSSPERFNQWFRDTVISGTVDTRPLLGIQPAAKPATPPSGNRHLVLGAVALTVVIGVLIVGFVAVRKGPENWS